MDTSCRLDGRALSTFYSVGHSNHSLEAFLHLLNLHDIGAIADVRSQPYSRYNPQFNRETVHATLNENSIAYVYLGKELGARSEDAACYTADGQISYALLAQTALFKHGVERLERGASEVYERIAMMCAERDPLHCHRTLLVTRQLVARGHQVRHILADGALETQDEAARRLCEEELGGAGVLFGDSEDSAWSQRERTSAYRRSS